ncbi:RING-type E3 ubiquitin transferase rfp1 [Hyphodiscus hymeniophilus]|uniref:RING-type E3 ubiquitin transferase rfp1 n=1 Tax=Hyphodiscus hymeniophilus TaxID=353542 RepID=A0A9P6VIM5_9HELO|nr:RING-type E3 ubiquitin transferase rfp1 [Hyphodiscus hymeniophilus]
MSQVTLSPSPISFRGPSSNFSRYSSTAPPNNDFFFERRRTSHPHNPPIQHSQAMAEDMSQQSQPRPRLEHRASQTLIDLTDDSDDVPVVRRPPPQLGRSDGQRLAFQVIDLTDDDADVQITGARNRGLSLPQPDGARPRSHLNLPRPARSDLPGLFLPFEPPQPERHINRVFPQAGHFGVMVGPGGLHVLHHGRRGIEDVLQQVQRAAEVGQAMPGRMDYRHPAFMDHKPEYVAPEPAKPGFTRSPTENDTIICPSCDEELVHDKEHDEPLLKKSGKAPTKKEREEHPFWVVRDCGHVYCNHCFQNRRPAKNKPANVSFPEGNSSKKAKAVMCAVDDCDSDVTDKTKWIGVFL